MSEKNSVPKVEDIVYLKERVIEVIKELQHAREQARKVCKLVEDIDRIAGTKLEGVPQIKQDLALHAQNECHDLLDAYYGTFVRLSNFF